MEVFHHKDFLEKTGLNINFVQDNQSTSHYGVLRGLHLQMGDASQAKLVRVIKGEVIDAVVDLRIGSETYGQHFTICLSGENKKQLIISRGFAHGIVSLAEKRILEYKCANNYKYHAKREIRYNVIT